MQLEAIESAHRGLATLGQLFELPVTVHATIVAANEGGRIDKGEFSGGYTSRSGFPTGRVLHTNQGYTFHPRRVHKFDRLRRR